MKIRALKNLSSCLYWGRVMHCRFCPSRHRFTYRLFWFLFDFIGDLNSPLVPETKENITHCEWVTIDNIDKIFKNTHERIKYIIDLFLVDLKNSKKITT